MLLNRACLAAVILACTTPVSAYSPTQVPLAIQKMLNLGGFGFGAFEGQKTHYSTFEPEKLPIDIRTYENDLVARVQYGDDIELQKFLFSHKGNMVQFKRWGKNNVDSTVDIQIDGENLLELTHQFPNIEYTVIIADLAQKVFESYPEGWNEHEQLIKTEGSEFQYRATEEVKKETEANVLSEFFFKDYRPLETINAWLTILEQSFPGEVSIETIGYTQENRPLNIVHFSADPNVDHSNRKTIVVSGGVHAREWISVSSVLYTLYEFLLLHQANPDSDILSKLDFLFIPVFNPDGYEYTWNSDRLWRKNRQATGNEHCVGIDIDHSYDYHWTRSSDWECSEEYSGDFPFEALESRVWEEYLNKTRPDHNIFGFLDLHSYSQEVLFPYAYSCNQEPRDKENLIELAYGISKSIRLESGKTYNVLPACIDKDADLIPDLGAGSGLDFMYHNKAHQAYQLKLRDSGTHGFLLPGKYIEPVGREIFAGIKYFCIFVLGDD